MRKSVEYKGYNINSKPSKSNVDRSGFIVCGTITTPLIKDRDIYETNKSILGILYKKIQHNNKNYAFKEVY